MRNSDNFNNQSNWNNRRTNLKSKIIIMRTYFKIYQINSQVDIQDPKTKSIYQQDLYIQLDGQEYVTRTDALNALNQFLNSNTNDDGEYTILELYSN